MSFSNLLNKIKNKFSKSTPSSMYQLLGQEEGIKNLVQNFYQKMETDPLAKDCLNTHPLQSGRVPEEVKNKLFMFLSGWMGGPNLFMENVGPPRMRARHMHVKISEKERDQWLYCMEYALNNHSKKIKDKDYRQVMNSFMALAYRIQNIS